MTSNAQRPVVVQGHTMFLASPGRYPPLALATDRYEAETTRLIKRHINPGMVVIDIGAHVGYFSLLAARETGPAGKVYAFEPEPQNYQLLLSNIENNGYENIVATQMAVSNVVGSAPLFISGLDNGRNSTYHHGLPERGSEPVETTTVDAFMAAEGWPKVDLAKVDVEGAEMDVLSGMSQLLDRSRDLKLIIEFSPCLLRNAGTNPLHFLEELASLRFEVTCIADEKESTPLQADDYKSLVYRLLRSEVSLNLFCSRL